MINKSFMVFTAGIAIGAITGIFGSGYYFKKKFENAAKKQIDEMAEYYGRTDEYLRGISDEDDEVNPMDDDIAENGRDSGILSDEKRKEIKQRLQKNWKGTTDYASMYKNKRTEEELAESEHPLDQGEFGEESSGFEEDPADLANKEHEQNRNKPPKIISYDEASALPGWINQETLYFYKYDGSLVTDNDEEIPDPETFIGDALDKFGYRDNDEMLIFVMNYALDTCYEVQKVDASWSDQYR